MTDDDHYRITRERTPEIRLSLFGGKAILSLYWAIPLTEVEWDAMVEALQNLKETLACEEPDD